MMTGNKHDIRHANKKGLAALLDFAVSKDNIEASTAEESDGKEGDSEELVEAKGQPDRTKLGNKSSPPDA